MALNWMAVIVAAVSAFALGGIWYGPLFKQAWAREAGIDLHGVQRHPAKVFGVAFVAALVAAAAFAWWLGPAPELEYAVRHGVLAGAGIAAMSFGINYAFAGRSFKLWLIDGGYHTLQFALYGMILGAWH
ncbi:MAG: DUF1761 domain-containing protein [Luteimonas sp.]